MTYRLECPALGTDAVVSEDLVAAACDGDANLKFPDNLRQQFVVIRDDTKCEDCCQVGECDTCGPCTTHDPMETH